MIIHSKDKLKQADFPEGVTLLVDKPLHWSSFDVVNKLRYTLRKFLGVKKIKVGHAGTLDPLATGLLLIAIGKDTRKIDTYQGFPKRYAGSLQLGATTPSYDSEFEPDAYFPTVHITPSMIEEARKKLLGRIEQVPPAFSAIKIKGKRAYKLARRGETPELKVREVEIFSFDIDSTEFPVLHFDILCSKGTYIRSIAFDLGKALHSGAYLTGLRRIAIGEHEVSNAFTIDEIVEALNP